MDSWEKVYTNLLNHGYSKGQAAVLIGRCYRLALEEAFDELLSKDIPIDSKEESK